jgi:hypothetical protein
MPIVSLNFLKNSKNTYLLQRDSTVENNCSLKKLILSEKKIQSLKFTTEFQTQLLINLTNPTLKIPAVNSKMEVV